MCVDLHVTHIFFKRSVKKRKFEYFLLLFTSFNNKETYFCDDRGNSASQHRAVDFLPSEQQLIMQSN